MGRESSKVPEKYNQETVWLSISFLTQVMEDGMKRATSTSSKE
jgi:hypothetical protein